MKFRLLLVRTAQIAFVVAILGVLLGFTDFNLVQGAIKRPLLAAGLAVAYACHALERILSLWTTTHRPDTNGDRKSRRKAARGPAPAPPPEERLAVPWTFWAALGAYLGWYVIAWIAGPYDHHGLALLRRWILYLGCFFGVGLFFPKRVERNRLLALFFSVAILQTLYAFLQFLELDFIRRAAFDFGVRNPFTGGVLRRVMGTLDNPGYFGGYMAGCLALGAGLLLTAPREKPWRVRLLWLASVGIGLALLLSFSRSALLATFVAGVVILGWTALCRGELRRLFPVPNAALIVLGAVVVLGIGGVAVTQHDLVTRIGERFTGKGELGALSGRKIMYQANLGMITSNPVLGVGPGNYFSFFRDYRDTEFGNVENPSQKVNEFAHSEFMQQAIELGLPGLLFYLVLVGLPLAVAARRLWKGPPGPDDVLLLCVSAAVFAGLAANAFDVLLQQIPYAAFLWTLFGWMAATLWVREAPARRHPAVRLAWLLVLPVAFWCTQAYTKEYIADTLTYSAQVAVDPPDGSRPTEQDVLRALRDAEKAVEIAPHDRRARYFLGTLYYSKNRYQEAADVYEHLLAEEGRFADVVYNLGTFHFFLGNYERAAELYRQAIVDYPGKADYHFQLGQCYWFKGRQDEAREAYTSAIELYEQQRPFARNRLEQYDHLATCYMRLNRFDEAARVYTAKLDVEPPPASDTRYWLGFAELIQGRFPEAAQQLEIAAATPPGTVGLWQVHHHLGEAYWGMGNAAEARVHLEEALRTMPPDYKLAAELRQRYKDVLPLAPR